MEDEILEALTDGIGAILGRGVRRQYYELKKQLKEDMNYCKFNDEHKHFAIDVLALSVFHHFIILPMDGAEGLWKQLTPFGISSIKMRSDCYKSKDFDRMEIITGRFFSILNKQKIRVELLYYESLDAFVSSLHQFIRERAYEEI